MLSRIVRRLKLNVVFGRNYYEKYYHGDDIIMEHRLHENIIKEKQLMVMEQNGRIPPMGLKTLTLSSRNETEEIIQISEIIAREQQQGAIRSVEEVLEESDETRDGHPMPGTGKSRFFSGSTGNFRAVAV
mgnify:CR=1 FL=1